MASKAILEQKIQLVAELVEKINNSTAGVLVNYQGITVDDDTVMRKALREAGIEYKVSKNTMTGRACDMTGLEALKPHLEGMTAIAISPKDPVASAKILKQYDEKIESFKILGGYLDGKVIDRETVIALADIPPKEELIAKFLGSIQGPIFGLAYVLQSIVDKGDSAPAEATEAPVAAVPED